jgi:hypothetical protein
MHGGKLNLKCGRPFVTRTEQLLGESISAKHKDACGFVVVGNPL